MIKLTGIGELKKELEALEKKVRNQSIRQAQREAMKVLAAEVRREAPKETGKLSKSVKVRSGKRKKDTISTLVEVFGSPDGPYVAHVELGTAHNKANPFLRRSVASEADQMGSVFAAKIVSAIEKNT